MLRSADASCANVRKQKHSATIRRVNVAYRALKELDRAELCAAPEALLVRSSVATASEAFIC
jgi:hypothetical protein